MGLLVIAAAGVFVPLLTERAEVEAERVALKPEIEGLHEALLDANADEADVDRVVTDLEDALRETTADEADLAAQLDSVHASQARFELYEDNASEWRWRLRHQNGNSMMDSGEG